MPRLDVFHLRKAIPFEEFDYALISSVLSNYSGVRQKINALLKREVIMRVKKGLYVFGPGYNQAPVCRETLANLIYGPSCLSLEYALAFHGLIPERVEVLTSVTPKRDKAFNTPLGRFTYRYLGWAKYPHKIEQVWIDSQHPVLMASPEKALCDLIVLNKLPRLSGKSEAVEFLQSDLRIDRENWRRFDKNILGDLNRFYRDPTIQLVQEIL